jgi:hypothetical protein
MPAVFIEGYNAHGVTGDKQSGALKQMENTRSFNAVDGDGNSATIVEVTTMSDIDKTRLGTERPLRRRFSVEAGESLDPQNDGSFVGTETRKVYTRS